MRTSRTRRGYSMLELLLAMSIFMFLGTVVVFLMRQGLNIFATGARDSNLQDRVDVVLPQLVRKWQLLALPPSFDPPPRAPTEEERMAGTAYREPPPETTRLRATSIVMRDQAEGALKDMPCTYVAWVIDISGDRTDPLLRRAGERSGPDLKELTQAEVDRAEATTAFLPTSGLREVCYVAVAEDERYPSILTLYHGWRSPVGGEGSLLDPANLDTLREIRERCRPVARGLLYFGVTFRRVFSTNWEPTRGRAGETEPYVGPVWDSTRALDKTFALYRGPESLGDPSDDIFPAWVRLEVVLAAPSIDGFGRGETDLAVAVDDQFLTLSVDDATPLFGAGPTDRFLKVDAEWFTYSTQTASARTRLVPVQRGQRGSKAGSHESGAPVHVGLHSRQDVRLLFHDRYANARPEGIR